MKKGVRTKEKSDIMRYSGGLRDRQHMNIKGARTKEKSDIMRDSSGLRDRQHMNIKGAGTKEKSDIMRDSGGLRDRQHMNIKGAGTKEKSDIMRDSGGLRDRQHMDYKGARPKEKRDIMRDSCGFMDKQSINNKEARPKEKRDTMHDSDENRETQHTDSHLPPRSGIYSITQSQTLSDNPGLRSHRQRNKSHDISSDMEFSLLVSRSLDVIGCNQDMIKHRTVDFWKWMEIIGNNEIGPDFELIYTGSQKEGIVTQFGSDMDMMCVYNTVVCADNHLPFTNDRNLTVFQTDNRDTEPGYTKLKIIQMGNINSVIEESLFISGNGNEYISSDFFTDLIMIDYRKQNKTLSKAGPAVPVLSPLTPGIVHDKVFCFKCYCPAILQSWLRRPRRYNWPPRNILYEISQMEAHVVPVGCKGSDTYYQEWRICFTKAEIHLVHNFNDTQIKLYIILKMVAKSILKSICPEITSYIIKNIVLWMCESKPSELFTDHQLVIWIFKSLEFLKKCIKQNYLPSYMIPERNLFNGRIEPGQKQELTESLSSFIEEGPAALFQRLDKIRGAMSFVYQDPERAVFYRITINSVEKLYMLLCQRRKLIVPRVMTVEEEYQLVSQDELYMNIITLLLVLVDILLPQSREKLSEKLKTILS